MLRVNRRIQVRHPHLDVALHADDDSALVVLLARLRHLLKRHATPISPAGMPMMYVGDADGVVGIGWTLPSECR